MLFSMLLVYMGLNLFIYIWSVCVRLLHGEVGAMWRAKAPSGGNIKWKWVFICAVMILHDQVKTQPQGVSKRTSHPFLKLSGFVVTYEGVILDFFFFMFDICKKKQKNKNKTKTKQNKKTTKNLIPNAECKVSLSCLGIATRAEAHLFAK